MKLLVVDDHTGVRRLIAAVLQQREPEIIECADGAAAVAAYELHRPDVVLMDVVMEGLDGIAATSKIAALDPGACVVMVTNHDGRDLRDAARRAGARAYVLKDNLVDLLAVLGSLGWRG
jgi:DNA-binding NarL/FixJ family response regulator